MGFKTQTKNSVICNIMPNLILHKYYMDITLDFGEEYGNPAVQMDENMFKYAITMALKQLHGDKGCSVPVDVIKYDDVKRRGFIRFPGRDLTCVWSALTLFSKYDGLDCAFRVHKATPLFTNLAVENSRWWQQEHSEELEPRRKKMKWDT